MLILTEICICTFGDISARTMLMPTLVFVNSVTALLLNVENENEVVGFCLGLTKLAHFMGAHFTKTKPVF